MDIELINLPMPAEKKPVATSQRKFIKDEAVLARFGKRQQLRVGAFTYASVVASLASESLNWKADYADSVLQRGFGLLPVIGLTSTLMITWEAMTTSVHILSLVLSSAERSVRNRTLLNGLQNGGPAGLIYGYLFVWLGATLQALVMAEMASM